MRYQKNRVLPALALLCLVGVILFIAQSHDTIGRYARVERSESSISRDQDSTTSPSSPSEDRTLPELGRCLPEKEFDFVLDRAKKPGLKNRVPLRAFFAYEFSNRIMVTTNSGQDSTGIIVYCRYLDADQKELGEPLATAIYPDYVVHCCKRPGAKFMAITWERTALTNQTVPIKLKVEETKHNLSVCLAPLRGDEPKMLLVAQLVEHYRLQGVDHHYFYVNDVDESTEKLLRYYEKRGDATVIFLDLKYFFDYYDSHLFSIQDCNQRAKHTSRLAIVQDLDELILAKDGTVLEYAREKFGNGSQLGAIQFRVRWVLSEVARTSVYNGSETLNELPLMRYHNTSSVAPVDDTAKCIIDPLKVMASWIHWPSMLYPGAGLHKVAPEDGYVRHYRKTKPWDRLKAIEAFGGFNNTNYPEHLVPRLLHNVESVLNATFLQ